METILYIAHTDENNGLNKNALEVLQGAVKIKEALGADLTVGLFGADVKSAADAAAGCGAVKILSVSGPDFADSRYSTDAAALTALIKESGASIVLAPATSRISRSLPGAATRAGGRVDTHVSGIEVKDGKVVIQRWYYRQRMAGTLTRTARPWVLLVDSGVFPAYEGAAGSASPTAVNVTLTGTENLTQVTGLESPSSDAQTIRPDAEILFVAGAGWTKKQADGQSHIKDAEGLILGFLSKAKASLGSSKSLVDQSAEGEDVLKFMSHLNQIGQTGATPRHQKGLATCCHGEEPHVVGWRFINERRAINKDAACGWAQGKTDVLYVGDAFEIMQKVNELL